MFLGPNGPVFQCPGPVRTYNQPGLNFTSAKSHEQPINPGALGGDLGMRRGFGSVVAAIMLAGLTGSCGGEEAPPVDVAAQVGAEPAAEVPAPVASGGDLDCRAFPEDLIRQVAMGYTAIRQLDPARNLETLEELQALPEPAAFRAFANAFEQLDVSGIEALQFDTPDTTAAGQRQLADLLAAALAVRDDPGDPAWVQYQTFVAENVTRQQLSMNYYMSEAGCV